MRPRKQMGVNLKQLRKGRPKRPDRPPIGGVELLPSSTNSTQNSKVAINNLSTEEPLKNNNRENGKMRTKCTTKAPSDKNWLGTRKQIKAGTGISLRYENGSTSIKTPITENLSGPEGGKKKVYGKI